MNLVTVLKQLLSDPVTFAQHGSGLRLRSYQEAVATAIADSVIHGKGLSIVVIFPRQSGKNELQAQIETYLLRVLSSRDAEIVKVSPTWKPQTQNAMRRLQRVLERNLTTRGRWCKESGYIYRLDTARVFFLSGSPTANVVGATASTLLECDEAQDVLPAKWDKDFAPMAASTNATRVFWGTMWTSRTLLAREWRAAMEAERQDGQRRVFVLTCEDVAREVPAYGKFVAEQTAKLGRQNPMVKTQYYSEEIDAEGGMFPPARLAMMQGTHPPQNGPTPGKLYAVLIDVAGADEGAAGADWEVAGPAENTSRDATAVTIVEVDTSTVSDDLLKAPTYRIVARMQWTNVKHSALYSDLRAIIDLWRAVYVVIDATGIGAGISSFLDRAFPGKILPFVFNTATKSKLGWDFIALSDSGRFKDYDPTPAPSVLSVLHPLTAFHGLFKLQAEHCQYEVIPGPAHNLRWSVAESQRNPHTGELLHDDLLLSAALVAVLDEQPWPTGEAPIIVRRADPLDEMDREGW